MQHIHHRPQHSILCQLRHKHVILGQFQQHSKGNTQAGGVRGMDHSGGNTGGPCAWLLGREAPGGGGGPHAGLQYAGNVAQCVCLDELIGGFVAAGGVGGQGQACRLLCVGGGVEGGGVGKEDGYVMVGCKGSVEWLWCQVVSK